SHGASVEMPALPGATMIALAGVPVRMSALTIACSRAPCPKTKIFTGSSLVWLWRAVFGLVGHPLRCDSINLKVLALSDRYYLNRDHPFVNLVHDAILIGYVVFKTIGERAAQSLRAGRRVDQNSI
ncbi:MAG: hypothetical protein RLZZ304_1, partial [Actinomycetota bacterium]